VVTTVFAPTHQATALVRDSRGRALDVGKLRAAEASWEAESLSRGSEEGEENTKRAELHVD
jgi:hypothetical protein